MTLWWLGWTLGLDLKIPSQIDKGISSSVIVCPSCNLGGRKGWEGERYVFPSNPGKKTRLACG